MSGRLDKKTVLLLGTGRSGTTWLAGLLAGPFRYRLLFEPFHPEHVPGAEVVADRFHDPDRVPDEVRNVLTRALNDEIDSEWIAQGSNRRFSMHRWRFWPRVRICKSIRTNLSIPVYRRLFGDELSVIVLVRDPMAVVESFLRVRFPWATDLDVLLEQREFASRYGLPLDELSRVSTSQSARLATRWALENGFVLRHHQELGIHLVRYEDLVADPAEVVREICSRLGLQPAADLDERSARFSHTTHPRSPLLGGGSIDRDQHLEARSRRDVRSVLDLAEVRY